MRIRLHIWPSGVKRLDSPHDHRSWFISLPLWGVFEEKKYIETDTGEEYDVVKCHATTSGNGKPNTTPHGKGGLVKISSKTHWPLVPYICRRGEIHSFMPKSRGYAASIVLFGTPGVTPKAWLRQK